MLPASDEELLLLCCRWPILSIARATMSPENHQMPFRSDSVRSYYVNYDEARVYHCTCSSRHVEKADSRIRCKAVDKGALPCPVDPGAHHVVHQIVLGCDAGKNSANYRGLAAETTAPPYPVAPWPPRARIGSQSASVIQLGASASAPIAQEPFCKVSNFAFRLPRCPCRRPARPSATACAPPYT